MRKHIWVGIIFICFLFAGNVWAEAPTRVTLPPLTDTAVILTIHGGDGKLHKFTRSDLEAMGTFRVETKTFWPKDDGVYEGIMLSALLKKVGLHAQAKIRIKALDDYATWIPKKHWEQWPIMLATRRNGAALKPRTKGPTRIIYPMAMDARMQERSMGTHWAWMIKSIETSK